MVLGKLDSPTQKNQTKVLSHIKHKNNFKMLDECKTWNHKISRRKYRQYIGLSNFLFFFVMSPQSRETKAKINKWYCIKLKNFLTVKKTIDKTKMPATECKKYLQMIYLIRDYIQNIQRTHTTQHQRNKQPD